MFVEVKFLIMAKMWLFFLVKFFSFFRYAGEAGNYSLVMFAARNFWNACLPLLDTPHDREQFKEPTKIILKNIIKAESKNKQVRISNRSCLFLVIRADGKETSRYLS